MLDTQFDKIYVINLAASEDRRRYIAAHFEEHDIGTYELFDAAKGSRQETARMRGGEFLHPDPWKKRHLSDGEVGCYFSHVGVWLDMLKRGFKRVLVFEDDARLAPNAASFMAKCMSEIPAEPWTIVHFCCNFQGDETDKREPHRHRVSESLVEGFFEGGSTVCYALSDVGAMCLLRMAFPIRMALDGLTAQLTDPAHKDIPEHLRRCGYLARPIPCSQATHLDPTIMGRPEVPGNRNRFSRFMRSYRVRRAAHLARHPRELLDAVRHRLTGP